MEAYQLLNLTPLASRQEVETRYKELCATYPKSTHPEERKVIDEAYQEIMEHLNKTRNHKISHGTLPETPSQEEHVSVDRDEAAVKNDPNSKKTGKWKLVVWIGTGLVAGVMLSAAAFAYFEKESDNTPSSSLASETASKASNTSSTDNDDVEVDDEQKAEEKKAKELKKQEALEQKKEDAVSVVNDIGLRFYKDLENSLIEQTASGMSTTTAKFRNEFQPSLNSLRQHDSIFEGTIDMRDVDSSSIRSVDDQQIVARTTADYSSRSYNPYLQEEPAGNAITWELTFTKQGDDWLVDGRKLIKDEASTEKMAIREEVKDDLASTINMHAMEWEEAYEQKDSSLFTQVDAPAYIQRQEKYYKTLDQNSRYYEGEFLGVEVSYDSVEVTQGKNITATVQAKANYDGAYFDMDTDEMVDVDDTTSTVFEYTLWYRNEDWVIINTKELNGFTKGDVRTFNDDDYSYDEDY
ncbi:J domain-containing protein [Exiguobacterium sp. MH3]|uniref:J domain-containing protein n=1 Tax=Exiguobacterium sp. MH3 TaxID=1399115 RepID=UPI0003C3F433|nr:J domain-containing protein [Exiguobacterium sp. MH3]AHA31550.1 hypothetical protein U719_14720 [Exiguobacterium sp. MH3]